MTKKFKVDPRPFSILGSLRSIGYNLKTALCDIVDNSIAANANKIEIVNNDLKEYSDSLEWLAIVDDGNGMTIQDMINAFTLGGHGIEEPRNETDLGRFGLGLKTASFSQCRKLTLISKTKKSNISSLVFDLEHIKNNGWEVYSIEDPATLVSKIKERIENKELFESKSWTVVYWENLDKIKITSVNNFYSELTKVRNHFELIYHKFINKVDIRLNGTLVKFWNPYENAISGEKKYFKFDASDETYSLKGHVLKHSSEFMNKNDYDDQSRIGTFNQNQGFFVYRNDRLIYRGSWLGLYNKEHHYILARIEINLSNSLKSDLAWGVNISKSVVSIPSFSESDIRAECNLVRAAANNTFRFHGGVRKHKIWKNRTEAEIQPIWCFESKGVKDGEKNQYRINKEHPLLKSFLKNISTNDVVKNQFNQILKYLENYLPIDNIFARRANNEVQQTVEDPNDIYEQFKGILEIYKLSMNVNTAFYTLINVEPFNSLSFDKEQLIELGIDSDKL